jgi:HEAT repeat protein
MRVAVPKLRMWHLLGLVATVAASLAVARVRSEVDPIHGQIRQLHYAEAPLRAKAARELGEAGHESLVAVDALIGALNDRDARVRQNAAQSLASVLVENRDDPRAGAAMDGLTLRLDDRDDRVRASAAIALAHIGTGPKLVIPRLIEAAHHADADVRRSATLCLDYFSNDNAQVRQALLQALEDPAPGVRTIALCVLRQKNYGGKVQPFPGAIAKLAGDHDAGVRAAAAGAMGTLRIDPPRLVELLGDPDSRVRTATAASLQAPDAKVAVPALIRALGDAEYRVRAEVAGALGRIGVNADAALTALRVAMEDQNALVRQRARSAHDAIVSANEAFLADVLPTAIAQLGDPDSDVRRAAADVLGDYGPKSAAAVPALIRGLADRDVGVRRAVARTLGRIGPPARAALPALNDLMCDTDSRVRRAAEAGQAAIRDIDPPTAPQP